MVKGRHWVAFEICQVVQSYCLVVGLCGAEGMQLDKYLGGANHWCIGTRDGRCYHGTAPGFPAGKLLRKGMMSFPVDSVMGLEYDADAGTLRVWKDGALLGTACAGVCCSGGPVLGCWLWEALLVMRCVCICGAGQTGPSQSHSGNDL